MIKCMKPEPMRLPKPLLDDETLSPSLPNTQLQSHAIVVATELIEETGLQVLCALRNGPEHFTSNGVKYFGGYCDPDLVALLKKCHETTSATVAVLKLAEVVRTFPGRLAWSETTGRFRKKYYVKAVIPDAATLKELVAEARLRAGLRVTSSIAMRRYLIAVGELNPVEIDGKKVPETPQNIAHLILEGYRTDHPIPEAVPGLERQVPIYESESVNLAKAMRRCLVWKLAAKDARSLRERMLEEIRQAGVPLSDPKSVDDLLEAFRRAMHLKAANAFIL